MRKLVLVVFLTLTAYLTNAQKPTNAQVRQMNLMAIELLDRYELNSALWDKQAKSRFPRMFESSETEIFCDLYHNVDYYGNQISVDKYISFIEDTNSKIDKVQLSNIKKKDIWSYARSLEVMIQKLEARITVLEKSGNTNDKI